MAEIDDDYIKTLTTANEAALRDLDVRWPDTDEDLRRIVNGLASRNHEYGTCPYAMSIAALSAFYLVAKRLGVSAFQASFADMDFLRRSRGYKSGFSIVDWDKVLYPQYVENSDHWPTPQSILAKDRAGFAEKARKLLADSDRGVPEVRAHWEKIAAGGSR